MLSWSLIAGLLYTVPPAAADLYEDLYRGLGLLATPSGSPITTAAGFQVNGNRRGRLRIVPDRVGRGYTLEFDRRFGPDTAGRPEILDLGALELQMDGTLSGTLDYTSRGWRVGHAELFGSGVRYAARFKTGAQDVEVLGTIDFAQQWEFNEFGFYSALGTFSNSESEILLDGVLVNANDFNTNFDIGPINISGNIFFDAFVAMLASFGVDTTGLESIFPMSPVNRVADAIQEQIFGQAQAVVAGLSLTADGLVGPPAPLGAATADPLLAAGLDVGIDDGGSPGDGSASDLPEPATLVLMALGAVVALARRR
jgi:hypothetical protein